MSAQPGSSEVSKKLKAAIRAKLEELGVYVDDELPDYIMVMIANKKEKSQMKDDLNLFIGKSTAKFVDWLFDLFDRLQSASSKSGETVKKEEEKEKEKKEDLEEQRRKEKEEKEKELQKEKEKERERQKERDREKRVEEDKRREEKRRSSESSKNKRRRTRSRSNTYSDEEDRVRQREKHDKGHRDHHRRGRSAERKRVASTVVRAPSASPEPQKVHSMVTVKRNIRPIGDSTNVKARGSMFLRAMNEASVSAGYGSSSSKKSNREGSPQDDDDMSDVEALPSKVEAKTNKSPKKSVHDRLIRVNKEKTEAMEEDDAVVLGNQPQTGGPQMIVKLAGGKEAIKRTRIQDRIVIDNSARRGLLKRKAEPSEEPKSKHERITFDLAASRDSTPSDESPTMQKWNGQIRLGEDSESDDEEAQIDAFVAEARGIARHESIHEEEELPPTHQLSGGSFAIHVNQAYQQQVPAYIPTPLSVLQEQQNQMTAGPVKEDHHVKERCVFWPQCTKGDACAFMHPTKNCTNFPNCSYGIRCLFIHPACRFDRFCTKKHCPYTHNGTGGVQPGAAPPAQEAALPLTSNRVAVSVPLDLPKPAARGALGSLAAKLAASIKKKPVVEKKTDENEKETEEKTDGVKAAAEIPSLQSMIPCRYAGGCRNPVCHFKHPKECRFGANCRNASCYFYHKPASSNALPSTSSMPIAADSAAAKYKWTAAAP